MQKWIYGTLALLMLAALGGCSHKAMQTTKRAHTMFQSVPLEKAILLQKGAHKTECAICGMYLPAFYKTNHAADTKYGTRQYCSLHCLVADNELNKTDLTHVRVIDTESLQFIPALQAWYVVGSNKPATMSRVSKYAFKSKTAAEAFAKKYGGKVMDFYGAYDIAIKDFVKKAK